MSIRVRMKERPYSRMKIFQLRQLWGENKLTKAVKRGRYIFAPDYKFYLDGNLCASKVDDTIFIKHFYTGYYDNTGLNEDMLYYSIPKRKRNKVIILNTDSRLEYVMYSACELYNILLKDISNRYGILAYFKEATHNNRIYKLYYYYYEFIIGTQNCTIKELSKNSNNSARELYNIIKLKNYIRRSEAYKDVASRKIILTFNYYKNVGWNYLKYYSATFKVSINKLIKEPLSVFNEEEREIIYEKLFYGEYYDEFRNIEELREMYRFWKRKNHIDSYAKQGKINVEEEQFKFALSVLVPLFLREKIAHIRHLPYQVFRLIDDVIESSQKVLTCLNEGKAIYRCFCCDGEVPNLKLRYFGGIKYQKIPHLTSDGKIEYVNERCAIVGCHIIPESEARRFVKDNNLDWDN